MIAAHPTLFLAQLGATWFLTGLIWFVQVVHYPLMGRVGRDQWTRYEDEHQRRTTIVVAPAMLLELASTIALLAVARESEIGPSALILLWIAAGFLAIVWASTFLVQVPLHGVLSRGFDPRAHRLLVRTNWIRTISWSARAGLLAALLVP